MQLRFNRVELMLATEEIPTAVEQFNDVLGTNFAPPHVVADGAVLSTTDWDAQLELMGPAGPDSPLAERLASKGRGGIGPLVWEVDDLAAARRHVEAKGYRIFYEFEGEGVRQLCLDPEQWFGYVVTFMERLR